MTLGSVSGSGGSPAGSFCSCCGAKMLPYFSDDAVVSKNQINQLISESFLTVKGAALFLPRGNSPTPTPSATRISQRRDKHTGDLQKHLQTMFTVLRPEDTIRLAVRLESAYPHGTRYMVVVSTNGRQDTEESVVLGMDFYSSDSCCTVGLVLPLWSDTLIHLDGDGGFSVSTVNRVHVFKPVSVQAMWSALQSLHKACEVARCHNYYPGSLFLTWVSYYQSRVSSNQFCINEWNAMKDVESHRANSPVLFTDLPTERERTERLIKMCLREIMMQKDLENVTCKEIRTELEMQMVCNLREFKEFIDNEMIVILGQMDSPTEIFEHVYLGSEWNASNLEELQNSGVRYILNVTREIDNFFPGMFEYHNIRVYDEEATNLLEYWNETYKFITKAKKAGAKCLVHCKMGVSRSASTVIAYAMKEYGWTLDAAFEYVKGRRAVTKPNPSFMKQLEEYQGILWASKQRHNKLWRSHSDSDLSDRPEPMCKPLSHSLGRSSSHSGNRSSPSLHHFLGVAVLQALGAGAAERSPSRALTNGTCESPDDDEEEGSDGGDPLLPPLAAALVPEDGAVPVPGPPPSVHILPPTPELQRANSTPLTRPRPRPLELFLHFPERSSSEEMSPVTSGSTDSDTIEPSLSDLPSDRASPFSPVAVATLPPLLPSVHSDDDNNNNNHPGDGSSNHSSDSIDFFSAREKFLGLAEDTRTRTPSQEGHRRSASLESEDRGETEDGEDDESSSGSTQSEDGDSSDQTHHPHHDNGVSVRDIVTEIEAICHPASCPVTPSSSSSSHHSLQLMRPDPQEQPEVTHDPLTPPPLPPSPSMLPTDWPSGSVRRATEQLEQKLRQELETTASPRSPLHSPSAEHPPPPSPELHTTASEASKDREAQTGCSDPDPPPVVSHVERRARPLDASPHTSARTRRPAAPQDPPHPLSLNGATVQESDTDGGPEPDGRSRSELERIQQTLRELQAFLHEKEAGPQGPRGAMETEPGGTDRLQEKQEGKSLPEAAGWHRTPELEARIRQAGLTPPSLMKRSASLAKLDCLELSATDLSDLDPRPHARPPPSSSSSSSSQAQDALIVSPTHPDDTWKKQKVLAQTTRDSSSGHSGPLCSAGEEPDAALASSRQQGRGHSRRSRKAEKKQRAVALLYNTM